MSSFQCRGSIAWAALVIALIASSPADAQVVVPPGVAVVPGVGVIPGVVVAPSMPPEPPCLANFYIGYWYDVANQAHAEKQLRYLHGKIERDAERGDQAAVERDRSRIYYNKYRVAVAEALIRINLQEQPVYYPPPLCLDPYTRAALGDVARPPDPAFYGPRQGLISAGMITLTIVNAEETGTSVSFAIDGIVHQADGGTRQNLDVAPNAMITYDGGGSIGKRQYRLSPGLYEFRRTTKGWEFYKLGNAPDAAVIPPIDQSLPGTVPGSAALPPADAGSR